MTSSTPDPVSGPPRLQPSGQRGSNLAELLDQNTVVGSLWRAEGQKARCCACGHHCLVGEGKRGICRVRFNRGGELRVPFGYVAGLQCDPVEKKPFYHVYPGSDALTFGMLGCDFHCSYCQNWVSSQALRDDAAGTSIQHVTPRQIADTGRQLGARLVVSSYNEPLVTAEWAVAVFQEAKSAGLACAFVSNGNLTAEALDFLLPWIVAYKIDLKSFDDRHYRSLGGTLEKVTQGIRMVHKRGLWIEVVTLLVPGFNDGETELRAMAAFLASVSRDIPWHITAFHPDYNMTGVAGTTPAQLTRAAEIGLEAGLRFVYAGNAPGRAGRWEHSWCGVCGQKLIDRFGYSIREYNVSRDGQCPHCHAAVPGIWHSNDTGDLAAGEVSVKSRTRFPHQVKLC
jgi:pyruvate formate lyase activating enzyme